ncbi:MAG: sugar ABC transporter ATP-binding protein [candidate division WOR-3 bacterium]|nr:sugar ABC transporter ATP-binding protein [candidate division WOR-3 bacterium]
MLQAVNIRKEYPGTVALENVSVKFEEGVVHALIGKNGAGKTTLVKILAGAIQPTEGKIIIDDEEVELRSPRDAFDKGITTVYQELSLVPYLSVAENILLGRWPKGKGFRRNVIDWQELWARAESILSEFQVDIDVKKKALELGVGDQQVIEIAKAMSFNPSVIMLDEPTSALSHYEKKNLFDLIGKLKEKGVAIIYITHRLQELYEIADRVTVLRDGNHIGTIEMEEANPSRIAQMMFGEVEQRKRPTDLKVEKKPVLEVHNLSSKDKFSEVNFDLYKGEVLGIAGMVGSGRTELLKAIFGAEPFDEGEIILDGSPIKVPTPSKMRDSGVALIPENRKEEGLVLVLSTRANMCLASLKQISTNGITTKARETPMVNKTVKKLDIQVADIEQSVSSLSGGNQQKVAVGNWLNTNPKVILFDEPTKGIDVQAKQQIFQIIWNLSRKGISSIFVSTELEELIEVCHRILIMKKGRIVNEVKPEDLSANELLVQCMEK